MNKPEKNKTITFTVKTESREGFFARGKKIAALLDKGKTITPQKIITFEDTRDLIKFINEAKIALLSIIRKKPDTISSLARKLHPADQRLTKMSSC